MTTENATILATSGFDTSTNWFGLVVDRLPKTSPASWEGTRIAHESDPKYLTMSTDGRRRVVLVYTVSLRRDSSITYGFVSRLSDDEGKTWTETNFIKEALAGEDWPQVHWLDDGPHLFWAERPAQINTQTIIRHEQLVGTTWKERPGFELPGQISGFSSLVVGRGSVLIASVNQGVIHTTRWSANAWRPIPSQRVLATPGLPSLAVDRLGTVTMTFLGTREMAGAQSFPAVMASSTTASCR